MMLIKPDFVLIQFGLIDRYGCPDRQIATTFQEYATNLKTLVELVRGFGGVPILVTPTAPRVFDADGRATLALDGHSTVVRRVAAELQADLVDLHHSSLELFNELGESGSAYITAGQDRYHFTVKGAEVIAGLAVKDLPVSCRPYLARRPRRAGNGVASRGLRGRVA